MDSSYLLPSSITRCSFWFSIVTFSFSTINWCSDSLKIISSLFNNFISFYNVDFIFSTPSILYTEAKLIYDFCFSKSSSCCLWVFYSSCTCLSKEILLFYDSLSYLVFWLSFVDIWLISSLTLLKDSCKNVFFFISYFILADCLSNYFSYSLTFSSLTSKAPYFSLSLSST